MEDYGGHRRRPHRSDTVLVDIGHIRKLGFLARRKREAAGNFRVCQIGRNIQHIGLRGSKTHFTDSTGKRRRIEVESSTFPFAEQLVNVIHSESTDEQMI